MKQLICLATVFALAINYIMAQEKQAFTLDDLVPGGKSFYANQPKTAFYEWWGDLALKSSKLSKFTPRVSCRACSIAQVGLNQALIPKQVW